MIWTGLDVSSHGCHTQPPAERRNGLHTHDLSWVTQERRAGGKLGGIHELVTVIWSIIASACPGRHQTSLGEWWH
jgi:hypothetical protein